MRARTSQAAISRIERGLVSPSVSMLAQLLDLLGEELVLEAHAIDYGHDRTLLRANLARTPEERIEIIARVRATSSRSSEARRWPAC